MEKAIVELVKKEGELLKQNVEIETKLDVVLQEIEVVTAEADLIDDENLDLPVASREEMTSADILQHIDPNPTTLVNNPSTDAFNSDVLINHPASSYQLPVHSQQPPVYVSQKFHR